MRTITDSTSAMTRALFGQDARHVPAWLYVQDAGPGVVTFVGSSRVPEETAHPLRYGSPRAHQLIVGEIVVRPHVVVASDALQGEGLASLVTGGGHATILDGDVLLDPLGVLARLRQAWT